jgi:DnaJ-class molecular chaperone
MYRVLKNALQNEAAGRHRTDIQLARKVSGQFAKAEYSRTNILDISKGISPMSERQADAALEVKCATCAGTGVYLGDRCPDCEGARVVLTEKGAELLDFVARRLALGPRIP